MTAICNACNCAILAEFVMYFKQGYAVQHYHVDCFDKLQVGKE